MKKRKENIENVIFVWAASILHGWGGTGRPMVCSLIAYNLSLYTQMIWKEFAKFHLWLLRLPNAWLQPATEFSESACNKTPCVEKQLKSARTRSGGFSLLAVTPRVMSTSTEHKTGCGGCHRGKLGHRDPSCWKQRHRRVCKWVS